MVLLVGMSGAANALRSCLTSSALRRALPLSFNRSAKEIDGLNGRKTYGCPSVSDNLFQDGTRPVESYASSAGPSRPQRRARKEHVKRMRMPKVCLFTSIALPLHALGSGRPGATTPPKDVTVALNYAKTSRFLILVSIISIDFLPLSANSNSANSNIADS
jgi:hypothetical protein